MAVTAISPAQALLPVGDVWVLRVAVTDLDGQPVNQLPTITVTPPSGGPAAATVETLGGGEYRATYKPAATGRHIASAVTVDYGTVLFAAYANGPTTATGMPVLGDVAKYLREFAVSWSDEELQGALNAEAAAQRAVCRVGAVFPDDLREALLRRVSRNLAMRNQPLAVLIGDAEVGNSTVLPGNDPEVKRLEGPYRKFVFG